MVTRTGTAGVGWSVTMGTKGVIVGVETVDIADGVAVRARTVDVAEGVPVVVGVSVAVG